MRSASRPCSPVHHHEGHAKLAGSPPRASPVRMGPSYVLKKGSQELAPREGGPASPGGLSGPGVEIGVLAAFFRHVFPRAVRRPPDAASEPSSLRGDTSGGPSHRQCLRPQEAAHTDATPSPCR